MPIIKQSRPRKPKKKVYKRYCIMSEGYRNEYAKTKLGAYIHYYGTRLMLGGPARIYDRGARDEVR